MRKPTGGATRAHWKMTVVESTFPCQGSVKVMFEGSGETVLVDPDFGEGNLGCRDTPTASAAASLGNTSAEQVVEQLSDLKVGS